MNLTKKQVKALLEVISKDSSRYVLQNAYIDTYNDKTVLVATDSYKLVALELEGLEELKGQYIHRDKLERWCKLANTKDILTESDIKEFATKEDIQYPKWQALIPEDREPQAKVSFQASFLVTMETLAGNPVTLEFTGKYSPIIVTGSNSSNDLYVIMPLRA